MCGNAVKGKLAKYFKVGQPYPPKQNTHFHMHCITMKISRQKNFAVFVDFHVTAEVLYMIVFKVLFTPL